MMQSGFRILEIACIFCMEFAIVKEKRSDER